MFGFTVNQIRHMAIDALHVKYPNMSNDEMEEWSKQFGHSIKTHLSYRTKDSIENPPENFKISDLRKKDDHVSEEKDDYVSEDDE